MKVFHAQQALDSRVELGEGPVWREEDECLYWVNINAGELHRFCPVSGKDECFPVGEPIGTFAFCKDGGFVAALKSGIYRLDFAGRQLTKQFIADPEPDSPNRFNDGKCDPYGRFLAGTMNMQGNAAFYSIGTDGTCKTLLNGVKISNGLGFSPDLKTLYYTDSCTYAVTAYDYGEDGTLSNPREAVRIVPEDGMPDGLTIDTDGNLWIALFGGSCVICMEPFTGKQLACVEVPAKKVTCCAFGGADYETLYITTAWENSSPEQKAADPNGGSLFAVKTGAKGVPAFRYGK